MAAGMFGASSAEDVVSLSAWRVLTGLGIGGMLAATNAAVAEVSNLARRNLAVVLMAGGYPVGAVIGGAISAQLLRPMTGARCSSSAGSSPCSSCRWCCGARRNPSPSSPSAAARARSARINATLARMGHRARERAARSRSRARACRSRRLFAPALAGALRR